MKEQLTIEEEILEKLRRIELKLDQCIAMNNLNRMTCDTILRKMERAEEEAVEIKNDSGTEKISVGDLNKRIMEINGIRKLLMSERLSSSDAKNNARIEKQISELDLELNEIQTKLVRATTAR